MPQDSSRHHSRTASLSDPRSSPDLATHPVRDGNANSLADAKGRTDALLRDLWQRKLPAVRDHVRVLERARDLLTDTELHLPLRTEAAIAAHKLAGSLGMFGYTEGTHIARQLEAQLDSPLAPDPAHFTQLLAQLRTSLNL